MSEMRRLEMRVIQHPEWADLKCVCGKPAEYEVHASRLPDHGWRSLGKYCWACVIYNLTDNLCFLSCVGSDGPT